MATAAPAAGSAPEDVCAEDSSAAGWYAAANEPPSAHAKPATIGALSGSPPRTPMAPGTVAPAAATGATVITGPRASASQT
jgi:hypothetical protein